MALESVKISESFAVPSNVECSSSDGAVQCSKGSVQENEHLGDFLNDFESYWQDINDRLIISRVVSDSVIKGMVNAVSQEAAEVLSAKETEVISLKEQLSEGKMVQQLQAEVEAIVMENAVDNLRVEYERGLLCFQLYGSKSIRWRDNLKEVSSMCQDLDSVQKSLFNLEKLNSLGSLETDHTHQRILTNHVSPTNSLWEANIRHKKSSVNLAENFESSCLKHLTTAELYSYFMDLITKLKRDHETTVHTITEEYFRLKREYLKEREMLKERGSFLPLNSKDFDILRKKIPDVISKLNEFLLESEDLSKTCDLSTDRLDSLLAENHCLRDSLDNKKREVECLSLQVSEVEEKLKQHILDEASLSEMVGDLKKYLEDSNIAASVSEEVYKCILKEMLSQMKHDDEENNNKSVFMQEFANEEALHDTETETSLEYGEMSGIIFQEVLKDMEVQLNKLKQKCLQQDKLIISLESEASDMEKTLALEAQEKHKLKQNILELESLIEAKTKSLIAEKEQFEKELDKLVDCTTQQKALIFQRNSQLGELKANLEDSLQQVAQYKEQMDNLTRSLELAHVDSRKTVLQERNSIQLLLDAKDREYREQIETAVNVIQEVTKAFVNFELKTMENVKWNNLRLENSTFQVDTLIKKANVLRRTGLLYKQRLERRCSDLQKAEVEVDLLGDEVEALLRLLEKIYIALDHYSPVLQHYPGIMEILKLIKRELSGECAN